MVSKFYYSMTDKLGKLFRAHSLVTSKRIAFPVGHQVPLDILPSHFQHRFAADFINSAQQPVFDYYPMTKKQWSELSQSLNAFDMLRGRTP
jgi:hypothetical protein